MIKVNKEKAIDIFVPTALFLVAFLWKYINAGSRDICLDEPFTIFHAQDSLKNILLLPSQNEPNPPLFMVLLHFWIKIFGIGAYAVRTLPILFNALTVPFIYFIGKRFFGLWSGITASALFILSTYHFFFGGDTRTYSMLSFGTAATLYYLLALRENPDKKKYLAGLIISNLILVYGHYFGWFVIFIQVVVPLFYFSEKEFLKKSVFAIAATAILYIPMFSVLLKQFLISKDSTWVAPPQPSEYVQQLKWFMNSGTGLRILLFTLIIGIIVALVTKPKKEQLKGVLILLVWWIVPFTIMFFTSFKIPIFTNRYILFNSIGFYLFIGVTVNYLFQKIRVAGPVASLVLIAIMYMRMFTGDFAPRHVKEATDFIHSQMDSSTNIIIYAYWADLEFIYHYDKEIFKSVDNYEENLNKENIMRTWGVDDVKRLLATQQPGRIVLYQNNTTAIDSENLVFKYIDSVYTRTDSVPIEGGLVVSIFNKNKEMRQIIDSENN